MFPGRRQSSDNVFVDRSVAMEFVRVGGECVSRPRPCIRAFCDFLSFKMDSPDAKGSQMLHQQDGVASRKFWKVLLDSMRLSYSG